MKTPARYGLSHARFARGADEQVRLYTNTLAQRFEQVSFHAIREFGQILFRVLQKMRRGAMGFQRGIVLILFLDKEPARFGLVPMHLVHGTSRFLAGVFGQFPENCGNVCFVSNFRHPGDSQHHHRLLLPRRQVCRGKSF